MGREVESMKHHALQLFSYNLWANKKVLEHLKELPEGTIYRELDSGFSSISNLLVHIFTTDIVWFGVIRSESYEDIIAAVGQIPADMGKQSIEHIESKFAELAERYRDFLEAQEDLDRIITCEHPHFGKLETQLTELIQHVCNHGTYHRGNVTTMLRQLGYPGAPTDYIFYLYAGCQNQ
jgi:uncharacterized damage-inducible protein DinB